MKHVRTPQGLIVAAAASALLLLSGCSSDEPASKPTTTEPAPTQAPTKAPEPEKLEAPTSSDEAITGATAAVKKYMTIQSEALMDSSKVGEVETVAVGQALDRVQQAVEQATDKGILFDGEFAFEFMRGAAGPLTTASNEIEYGSVTVTGCYDLTGMKTSRADGSESQRGEFERYEVSPLVVFDQAEGRWVVYEWKNETDPVAC